MDEAGVFHSISRIDDERLAELFAREVLGFLVRRERLSPEWAERLLSWRHSGFSVHSRVRVKTKTEAERVGKYMTRPVLSLERLSFLESQAKVGYRYGQEERKQETMDYLEFIARVTSHIPRQGAGLGSLLWPVCQRPPGEGAKGGDLSLRPMDGRGGSQARPFQRLGRDDPQGL